MSATNIERFPLHLGLGATAVIQSEFTGAMDWYAAYGERHSSDGAEGRLVTMHRFSQSWGSWEMHPHGDEVVLCTAGRITLHREFTDGSVDTVMIDAGDYTINPPGVWHTADVEGEATALFITAGLGTQHRPR